MIFVSLGTQKHSFKRLCKIIDNIEGHEIFIQIGNTKYEFKNKNIISKQWISQEELEQKIAEAKIIISHGGVGSIMSGLEKNKKILVLPRLEQYKEHVNNHQVEIVEKFDNEGYIQMIDENKDINIQINNILKEERKKYEINNQLLQYFEKIV